ncbi:MAG: hypothetical protein ACXABO_20360 [Promethearchaeota archaeon]|jgi:hypothetical protein
MSKAVIWRYDNFIQSRKEKLTNMLLSEIIFLKTKLNNTNDSNEENYLKYGLDKLEYLLNKLEKYSQDIPETDFDKIILFIYQIFKDLAQSLE